MKCLGIDFSMLADVNFSFAESESEYSGEEEEEEEEDNDDNSSGKFRLFHHSFIV